MWQTYYTPRSLDEALEILAEYRQSARLVAGGTDLLLEIERGVRTPLVIVDTTRLPGMDRIWLDESSEIHLGPLITHNQVAGSPLCRERAFPLAKACWEVGAPQIRNRGTVAGNLATASPANDTIAPLWALGATVSLQSVRGRRTLPFAEFFQGVRKTALEPDEMIVDISFPAMANSQVGTFLKSGLRRAQAIGVANAAVVLTHAGDTAADVRIALGGLAPTIIRAEAAEQFLEGKTLAPEVIAHAGELAAQVARPISDVRGSADYRRYLAALLTRQALDELARGVERAAMPADPVMLWGKTDGHFSADSDRMVVHRQAGEQPIIFTINGQLRTIYGANDKTLLRMLREDVHLTGTKEGCAEGECGACTVLVDGIAVMSCLIPAPQVHGRQVTTIEGLAETTKDERRKTNKDKAMLITNGIVLPFGADRRAIANGAVYYEGDTIVEVGPSAELERRYPAAERLDAAGRIVMPGMICAHTHFYGAFARGMAIPGDPPANFMQILERLWWKLDRALTLEDSRYSALVCLVDAIRHGTTTLIDHHASPTYIEGSLDALATAVGTSGLRAALCYEVTDRNGLAGAMAGIAENRRFLKRLRAIPNPKLGASFGLHAAFTLSDDTLAACRDAAAGLDIGFHIHLAEDRADQADSMRKYGMRAAERLAEQGILGPRTLVAHAIHIDERELDILRATQTKVSHQPRSNMNNAVGVAAVEHMLDQGITVGLGNDGFSNNMFTEIHTAYLLHRVSAGDPRVLPGNRLIKMAFDNNAAIAGLFFSKPVGSLTPGAFADIILLDYHPYTPLTAGNYPWQLIFGMDGSHVTHTICAGQILMRDRELLTLDETAIAAHARELAPAIWRRVEEL